PDVMLLDAQLGGMSGLQVCEALKADSSLNDIAVVFVSGCTEPELESAALKIGAEDFIQKPFSPPQVVARVNNQLRLRRQTA
ncbi:diguanylate cyclase response regulator, partial [Halomonas sp. ND22Bw]|uniref:response regulator n=1 Tax=Halomonas sp. ND22Bw TaxID=2054178 RepID=UPI000D2E3E81